MLTSYHFREREMNRDRYLWPLWFSVIYRLFYSRPRRSGLGWGWVTVLLAIAIRCFALFACFQILHKIGNAWNLV